MFLYKSHFPHLHIDRLSKLFSYYHTIQRRTLNIQHLYNTNRLIPSASNLTPQLSTLTFLTHLDVYTRPPTSTTKGVANKHYILNKAQLQYKEAIYTYLSPPSSST